jgi:hypothetical protein
MPRPPKLLKEKDLRTKEGQIAELEGIAETAEDEEIRMKALRQLAELCGIKAPESAEELRFMSQEQLVKRLRDRVRPVLESHMLEVADASP